MFFYLYTTIHWIVLYVSYCFIQVEVIGGADKYMAVCRTCFQLPGRLPVTGSTPIRGGEISTGRQLFDFEDSFTHLDY